MTELDEVAGRNPGTEQVVGAHERILALVTEAVDEHVRDPLVAQPADRRVLEHAARQDDAVHPPRMQALQVRALPIRAAVRIAEQDVVAPAQRAVLDPTKKRGEEGVGDIGDHHRQDKGLSQLQATGDPVRPVFGFAQQRLDPLTGIRRDPQAGIVIRDPRDGGGMDLGLLGQLLQCDRHTRSLIDKAFVGAYDKAIVCSAQ